MTDEDVRTSSVGRYIAVVGIVAAVFLAAYGFAAVRSRAAAAAPGGGATEACADASGSGACCGTGSTAAVVAGAATLDGGVQRVTVDTASGVWSPGEIAVKAGVPVEITFKEGQGCLAQVVFDDFGITKDLTDGGAVVKLPALKAGEYGFRCGMSMVFGKVVAK